MLRDQGCLGHHWEVKSGGIPESDWKVFRELYPVWLERYCQRVNSELARRLSDQRLSLNSEVDPQD